MSIERILETPALLNQIAARLAQAAPNDPTRQRLPPERLLEIAEAHRSGKESKVDRIQEAIIRREGRPAYFVLRDEIADVQKNRYWADRIEPALARLQPRLPSVGRIDLSRHPQNKSWVGTGWLVAPDVVVTNRHVAREFATAGSGGFVFDEDPHRERVQARVDFLHERGSAAQRAFDVVRVLHIEPPSGPDVAILQISERGEGDGARPEPIRLDEIDPKEYTPIAAVGYPAWDAQRNVLEVMELVFEGIYDVKRFLPGEVLACKTRYLNHDCSTLGGNSGSVLISFETGLAVGLHYSGYYEDENFAVKASTLAELLHRLKIEYGAGARASVSAPANGPPEALTAPRTTAAELRIEALTASALDRVLGGAANLEATPTAREAVASGELTPQQTRELTRLVGRALEQVRDDEAARSDLGVCPDDEVSARLQSWLHDNASRRASVEALDGEIKFDERDLRWGVSLLNWLRGFKKHPRRPAAGPPATLPASCRIAVVGDWGTGRYAAPDIGKTIAAGGYHMAVDLGDFYYAGTEKEARENFLRHWPTAAPGLISRSLNSNHAMYSGGYGYFDLILPAFKQPGSYFAAQNDHFLLVGLDTGYDDHDLDSDQADWLHQLVAAAGGRKLVLMSHHQLFVPGKPAVETLYTRVAGLLDTRRILAWYWGHEHAAVVFEAHPLWGLFGRCIGHGGFPFFRHKGPEPVGVGMADSLWRQLPAVARTPAAKLLDDPNPYVAPGANPERYGAQGFASLELAGPKLVERMHRPDGTIIHERELAS